MNSIRYPKPLKKGDRVGVCAPSSGVQESMHQIINQSRMMLEKRGYIVAEGETIWTNEKLVSAPAATRTAELMSLFQDESIRAIIPPWGGEFLMEILPHVDWDVLRSIEPKWFMGYSDSSTFAFVYTLLTGYASAHGPNYFEMSATEWDETTTRWTDVLGTSCGESVTQYSSKYYQSSWDGVFRNMQQGFNLDTATEWKCLTSTEGEENEVRFSGRLLGGCMDTLSILIGTPYAPVTDFINNYCKDSGVIWFLESAEMKSTDIYRHLWQMRMNGWFENTNGILFGRPSGYSEPGGFTLTDALSGLADLGIPILYDTDIGHIPPQITLVNGAYSTVSWRNGKGTVKMSFI
ncbi:S66 family peptidase [Alicyclobacillus kakegawensis]|uniref:S66 family peptidase n=1 Tax=Alicyclobacillus kakegawensis TaxID=392012 RepID=UPI00082B0560|nr:S66 peptidase family protein [Alicyclobacillus kakegawensis]